MKKVLIIDDNNAWIEQGKKILNPALYEVKGFLVTDPQPFETHDHPNELHELIDWADAILVDRDLGQGINSTRLICVIRNNFPKLPIVQWALPTAPTWIHPFFSVERGYEEITHMTLLRVSTVPKPSREREDTFNKVFRKALHEQSLMHSPPLDLFELIYEKKAQSKYRSDASRTRIRQISEIARLAHEESVPSDWRLKPWAISGANGEILKRELGHCICDGDLTAEDIRPHLANLQKVIEKLEEADKIDDEFRLCAEFIKEGNPEQLELFRHCY